MEIELTLDSCNAEIEDGHTVTLQSGCYMDKCANFFHVELGAMTSIPCVRVTGSDLNDVEQERYCLVGDNDDFKTLMVLIHQSEYLGEV